MIVWKSGLTVSVIFGAFLATIAVLFQSPPQGSVRMDLIKQYRALNKTCFVLGASGESGKALIKELIRLKPFERIVLIGRRKLEYQDEELKKLEQRVIDFDQIENYKAEFAGFNVGYCCLGTTRGKAGAAGFFKIEHDYVLGSAKLAKEGGTEHFHLVSSMGVNENSWFLYGATKGRTDREVSELNFNRASIYRPGVLLCDREESRPLEAVFRALMKPVAFVAPTLMTTPIEMLAKAMIVNTVQEQPSGPEIVDNKRIHSLSKLIG